MFAARQKGRQKGAFVLLFVLLWSRGCAIKRSGAEQEAKTSSSSSSHFTCVATGHRFRQQHGDSLETEALRCLSGERRLEFLSCAYNMCVVVKVLRFSGDKVHQAESGDGELLDRVRRIRREYQSPQLRDAPSSSTTPTCINNIFILTLPYVRRKRISLCLIRQSRFRLWVTELRCSS